jgi:nicotinamidase-related amidase
MMNTMQRDRSVLVLVDYQQRLMPAIHEADAVLVEALALAEIAQALDVPVLGTAQNPQGLGGNVEAVAARCTRLVEKMHFDACADGLLEAIAALPAGATGTAPRDVVIAGCEAHVCLLQTALGLRRAGHAVWVVEAACGSRGPRDKALAMQRLRDAGATLVGVEMVAFEWLNSCHDERFRRVLRLLKQRTPR